MVSRIPGRIKYKDPRKCSTVLLRNSMRGLATAQSGCRTHVRDFSGVRRYSEGTPVFLKWRHFPYKASVNEIAAVTALYTSSKTPSRYLDCVDRQIRMIDSTGRWGHVSPWEMDAAAVRRQDNTLLLKNANASAARTPSATWLVIDVNLT